MTAALDKVPHVLIMELYVRDKTGDALTEAAMKAVEEAGATCERIVVVQPEDLVFAANQAGRSQKFDALVALAVVDGSKGKRRLITNGLQKVSLRGGTPIGHALIEEGQETPEDAGKAAAESAMRLFAIKARFNPLLNEV